MRPGDMTQQQAVRRAWEAAWRAEERAAVPPQRAEEWAAVAQAWAAVAAQLPLVADEMLLPEPALRPGEIAVPVPRPLRESDEQRAAVDALHGRDPLDPRVPVADLDTTVTLDAPAMHWPIDTGSSSACGGCASAIEWTGGAWVDIKGRARCVAR